MKYGKLLVDNTIEYWDKNIIVYNNKVYLNPTDALLQKCDIYPVVELKSIGTNYIKDNKIYHYLYSDLEDLKNHKIAEIDEYDKSDNINGFNLMGMTMWIPRETRVSLQNTTSILIKKGINETTLWEGLYCFNVKCTTLIDLLDQLEIYALQCFNKTAEHKATIMKMTQAADIINYDYTVGYPEKLSFTLS